MKMGPKTSHHSRRELGVGTLGSEQLAVALGGGTTRCAPPSRICIDVHGTLRGSRFLRIELAAGEIGSAVPITFLKLPAQKRP